MVLWRSRPLTPKQTCDRAATHLQPQLQHLALDFLRSPMRILPSKAKDPLLNLLRQWRSPGSALLPKNPVSAHELSMPAKQSVRLHDQKGLGQTPFREAQACQQQAQLLQTAVRRLPAQFSSQDQQLLAEEENLAVLVTREQGGQQRVKGCKKQQMEIVEHGVRVAGVGKQVNMQENEAHRGQLARSDADGFWTLTRC